MILAEEDRQASPASTAAETPAADGLPMTSQPGGMFTAINRHADFLSGGTDSSAHPSPLQAYQSLPGGGRNSSGGGVDLPTHPGPGGHADDLDLMENLGEWESSRIADCLGGVGGDLQGFSYGDVPDAHLLFGQVVPLMGLGGDN